MLHWVACRVHAVEMGDVIGPEVAHVQPATVGIAKTVVSLLADGQPEARVKPAVAWMLRLVFLDP